MTLTMVMAVAIQVFLATVMEDAEMRRSPALSNFLCLNQQRTTEVFITVTNMMLNIIIIFDIMICSRDRQPDVETLKQVGLFATPSRRR